MSNMTSDIKTLLPSLLRYIESDLFTFENIATSVVLETDEQDILFRNKSEWEVVVSYLPLKFYRVINSFQDIYTIEEFDKKYIRNPKMCAYEKYGTTNMWRPLMILNKCPNIMNFNFKFIRYYNIEKFSNILSVLISRIEAGSNV